MRATDPAAFFPCFVIPCYNHGPTLPALLEKLAPYGLPCIIVDDGSNAETAAILDQLVTARTDCFLSRHTVNQGKGCAVITGFREAFKRGYTHALQIDSDGQHETDVLKAFISTAHACPHTLISGRPVYDDSVPRSRFYARYITHVWVWIETLSFRIKDSMCGLRMYPLRSTMALLEKRPVGARMDFDTDIMVRLFWRGVPVLFIPTRVTYHEGGISHFRPLWDNLRISWMHTRLFLGMLPRIPLLLYRKIKPSPDAAADLNGPHWSRTEERHGLWGMRLMIFVYNTFGRHLFRLLLYPVITVFYLTGRRQRRASRDYLARLKSYAAAKDIPLPQRLSPYRHFLRFGEMMMEKFAVWQGKIDRRHVAVQGDEDARASSDGGKGGVILTAHLGNPELARALGTFAGYKVNALVFTAHAGRFNQVMRDIAPSSQVNLIPTTTLGPQTAILMREKIDTGEWVAIAADRTAPNNPGRTVAADFMGAPAHFPQGPFVLAAALQCPVYLMFGLREPDGLKVHAEAFANPIRMERKTREADITAAVQQFARRLEDYCLRAPLDWFNFYDFWQTHDIHEK